MSLPERFAAALSDLSQALALPQSPTLPQAPAPGATVVVAVSGGADSMVLWDVLVRDGRWRIVVWHLNHGLRAEAIDDAALIRAQADQYRSEGLDAGDVLIERAAIAELAEQWKVSWETAGRRHRYERLDAVARAHGALAVVTAHHRDDQSETVLANLLRGAGPVGRAGIAVQRKLPSGIALVRPLLGFTRSELRTYAQSVGVRWLDDASNQDLRHHRNYLRQVVLPTLEAGVPGIGAALADLGDHSRARLAADDEQVANAWTLAFGSSDVRLEPLMALPVDVRLQAWRRLVMHLGVTCERATLRRIDHLAAGAIGRRLHLGSWLLLRRARSLAWEPAKPVFTATQVVISGPGSVERGDQQVICSVLPRPAQVAYAPNEAWMDADQCRLPLTWRPALADERFTPFGAPGQQTVVKFLAGRGVPSRQRSGAAVIADTDGVVWVPGFTVAERVKLTDATRTVVHLCVGTACRGDARPTVPPLQDHPDAHHRS